MRRLLHAVIVGAIGAGIVHIAVLLMVPEFSERDAWSRLAMASDLYRMAPLVPEPGGAPVVKSVDPLFRAAACRFDLDDGVVHVQAPGRVPFWSMSVYDRNGQNIFSFNDRTSADGKVNFVVLTPAQTIEVRKQLPEEFINSVFVESDIDQGIVVVRAFVPDRTWRTAIDDFLSGVSCALR